VRAGDEGRELHVALPRAAGLTRDDLGGALDEGLDRAERAGLVGVDLRVDPHQVLLQHLDVGKPSSRISTRRLAAARSHPTDHGPPEAAGRSRWGSWSRPCGATRCSTTTPSTPTCAT
jgi:hypothetical protein